MNIGCRQKSMQVSSVTGSRQIGLGGAAQLAQEQQPLTMVGVGETVAVAVRVGVGVLVCAWVSVPMLRTSTVASVRNTTIPVCRTRPPTLQARA
jgi:hypothetical protein